MHMSFDPSNSTFLTKTQYTNLELFHRHYVVSNYIKIRLKLLHENSLIQDDTSMNKVVI